MVPYVWTEEETELVFLEIKLKKANKTTDTQTVEISLQLRDLRRITALMQNMVQ